MALADGDLYAYQITDRPGATLYLGYPPGRKRPALWIIAPEGSVILAQFHGEKEAQVTANFLDEMVNQINRVIQHYRIQNGEIDL